MPVMKRSTSYRLELLPAVPPFHRRARRKDPFWEGQLVYYGPMPTYYGIGEVKRVVDNYVAVDFRGEIFIVPTDEEVGDGEMAAVVLAHRARPTERRLVRVERFVDRGVLKHAGDVQRGATRAVADLMASGGAVGETAYHFGTFASFVPCRLRRFATERGLGDHLVHVRSAEQNARCHADAFESFRDLVHFGHPAVRLGRHRDRAAHHPLV